MCTAQRPRSESPGKRVMGARPPRGGMTLTELLVVIAGIAVLMSLLLPTLAGFRRSALMANSMSNLRQIAAWMQIYSADNREYILPSQFNYDASPYPGKVRATLGIDGSPADPIEVFWTAQIETFLDIISLSLISGSEIVIEYMGGSTASLALQGPPFVGGHCLGGQITVDSHPSAFSICASVTAVAVRTDAPVPVQETNIGRVKAMYK